MSLVVNHNMMASNVARNLNAHYGNLARSTERLSTGQRVNSAADDAAGLAIRELQRSDIAVLHQGARNANDAISMIQVADGALGVIDEKLIRMTELAEQAATGSYTSTQRLMIDSEFQQMASEIDRIANATDFNRIKLLDGSLEGKHDGSGMTPTGAMKIHFGTGNDSAEDYYYVEMGNATIASLFRPKVDWPGAKVVGNMFSLDIEGKIANDWADGLDSYTIPSGIKNLKISSKNHINPSAHKPHVNLFSNDGTQLTGYAVDDPQYQGTWWNGKTGAEIVRGPGFSQNARYDDANIINNAGDSVTHGDITVSIESAQDETMGVWEEITVAKVPESLVFLIGGHANDICNNYDLKISFEIEYPSIKTQEEAQEMLTEIRVAIERKDNIRAHLGAMQNRLENTITNLNIQAENLQASESRISDTDVATEMTEFTRNQILSQSAIAMLAQSNSLPQMAMQLIGG